jgi:hypothetical protein
VVTTTDVEVMVLEDTVEVMIETEVDTTGAFARSFPPHTLDFFEASPTVLFK